MSSKKLNRLQKWRYRHYIIDSFLIPVYFYLIAVATLYIFYHENIVYAMVVMGVPAICLSPVFIGMSYRDFRKKLPFDRNGITVVPGDRVLYYGNGDSETVISQARVKSWWVKDVYRPKPIIEMEHQDNGRLVTDELTVTGQSLVVLR